MWRGQQWSVCVKFLAHLPCNAMRHQANSLVLYKGRESPEGKHRWCPVFCWLCGKQLPPSAKSQQFPRWDTGIISTWGQQVAQKHLLVQSRTRSVWQQLLCTEMMLSYSGCKGQDDASVIEVGSQSCCSECLMGQSQLNPRLCCNSGTTYSQASRTTYYLFFIIIFFCNVVFSPHIKCHCRNK